MLFIGLFIQRNKYIYMFMYTLVFNLYIIYMYEQIDFDYWFDIYWIHFTVSDVGWPLINFSFDELLLLNIFSTS